MRPSTNPYDWLGHGAYFWENSVSRARSWAELAKKNPKVSKTKIGEPFVIGAIVDPGYCLDLSEEGCLEILRSAYRPFVETMATVGAPLPKNEAVRPGDTDLVKRQLDCAVINSLHQLREEQKEIPFDTVRSPFPEGGPLFEGSNINSRTHVQWCIRDPRKSVVAYFRPRPTESGDELNVV